MDLKEACNVAKEYFKNVINKEEKYIYSYIGAVICDDTREIQRVIEQLYNIEDFLLQIYKK